MKRDPTKCLEEIQTFVEELNNEAKDGQYLESLKLVMHEAKSHINHQRDEGFITGRQARKRHQTVQIVEQLLIDHRADLHDLQTQVENALADII